MQLQHTSTRIVAALVLGTAFCLSPLPEAHAIKIWINTDSDGFTENRVYTDKGKWLYTVFYDPDGRYGHTEYPKGNPSPDGQSTGLGPDKKTVQTMAERLKKLGASPVQETNFLKTFVGLALVESGKLPGFVDPWDVGTMMPGDNGIGGGGGGFDPGIPIREQIGKKRHQGNDDDDDDGDGGGGGDKNDTDIQPDVIDPPPEPVKPSQTVQGLWDVDLSTNASPNAKNSFVLMQPTMSNLGGKRGARRPMSGRGFNFGALGNGIAPPARPRPPRATTFRGRG